MILPGWAVAELGGWWRGALARSSAGPLVTALAVDGGVARVWDGHPHMLGVWREEGLSLTLNPADDPEGSNAAVLARRVCRVSGITRRQDVGFVLTDTPQDLAAVALRIARLRRLARAVGLPVGETGAPTLTPDALFPPAGSRWRLTSDEIWFSFKVTANDPDAALTACERAVGVV